MGLFKRIDSSILPWGVDERLPGMPLPYGERSNCLGIDKSGTTDLTGTYEVERGSYNLSLQS